MKIYEIMAKEMEKKPEERSFHFKQIEKYLKQKGFEIRKRKLCCDKTFEYIILNTDFNFPLGLPVLVMSFTKDKITKIRSDAELFNYLTSNRETLFSDKVTYHNILVNFYKHDYIEYLDLKNEIFDKMQKIFHNNMPFLYANDACHEIKFQFNGWGATISKAGGTSCAKEHADEWNKFM